MKKIIEFFIDRSFLVNIISVFICIVGYVIFQNIHRDIIPQFKFKVVTINAILPGASPIEMERSVTFPIEESINNLPGIKKITSTTSNSSSAIQLYYDYSYDYIERSIENIKSIVDGLKVNLPEELKPITIKQQMVESQNFQYLAITGIDENDENHREWIKNFIDNLKKIKGIVRIDNSMRKRNIFINFYPKKLSAHSLSVPQVKQIILDYLKYKPVSQLKIKDKEISIELNKGIHNIHDITKLPIVNNRTGQGIFLEDIAKVKFDFFKNEGLYLLNGKKSISMTLYKDLNSDAITLKNKVLNEIEIFNKKFPKPLKAQVIFDITHFLEKQLDGLKISGLLGITLVLVLLMLFLGFRISFFTAMGLPIAYLGTMIIIHNLDISINLISIIGLILVIGILVDDAIIVAEKYNQNLEDGMSPRESAVNAAHTMMVPITGTILTTIVAFSPILFVKNEMSTILFPIPVIVIASLLLSWFDSFFILPNHLMHFVKKTKKNNLYEKIEKYYRKILVKSLKFKYIIIAAFFLFLGFSIIFSTKNIKANFNLSIDVESLQVKVILKESKSIDETRKIIKPLEDFLLSLREKGISHVSTSIGSTWVGNKYKTGDKYAGFSIYISIKHPKPKDAKEEIKKIISNKLDGFKNDKFESINLSEKNTNSNGTDDVVTIYVSGGDTLSFEEIQNEIHDSIENVKNIKSIYIDENRLQPTWQFIINKKAILQYGINSNSFVNQLREVFGPQELDQIRIKGEQIHIYTQLDKKTIKYDELKHITILSQKGIDIPINYLGKWEKKKVLKQIVHKDLLRKFEIDVTYDKDKIKKDEITRMIQDNLKPVQLKYPAYSIEAKYINEQEESNKKWMGKILIICLLLILFVIAIVLNSLTQPILVWLAIPFGTIGIIWAIYFHGMEFNLMAIIGMIGMAGVVVNDSLVMVVNVNQIKKDNKNNSNKESIIEGASGRLKSIILTTVTTVGGVLPTAYSIGGDVGFTQPLAFAIAWGLLFATFLTLLVIPCLLDVNDDIARLANYLKSKVKMLFLKS